MDCDCDEEAEQGARLVSEYSLAECFLGVCCGGSVQGQRPAVGVAGDDIPEADIRAGQLLGEVDGSDYSPAPASLPEVWRTLAELGRDHYGRIQPHGLWVPEPAVGGSFAFVEGALNFVRGIVPRLHRGDIKRWECPEVNGKCHLVDLDPATSLVVAESA